MSAFASRGFAGLLVIGASFLFPAQQASAATLEVGGQASATTGSSVARVAVRVVYNGKSFMLSPVKVMKGGSTVRVRKTVDKVTFTVTVRWAVGPNVVLTAVADTPRGKFRATNTLRIRTN